MTNTRCSHHRVGGNPLTAVKDRFEQVALMCELGDETLSRDNAFVVLEPRGVVEEDFDGYGVDVVECNPLFLEKRLKCVYARRIEMPIRTRAQVHPLGHVLLPESHRFADDDCLDAALNGSSGSRHAVRAGTDHQKRRPVHHGPCVPSRATGRTYTGDWSRGFRQARFGGMSSATHNRGSARWSSGQPASTELDMFRPPAFR